jgi:CheY-like chemotaxis protein
MTNGIVLTKEQLFNLIKISGIDANPDLADENTVSKALIAIERKLNFFNYPLSFFTAENLNVLIVDDMELSIFQLTSMLKKIGMNVYVARNKEEAISEFKKKHFDYLIVDLFLPDAADGFSVVEEANRLKNEENKNFKTLVVSGTDDKQMVQKCYTLGVDEFIPKQPDWHEKVMKFISNSVSKTSNEEFQKYYINDNICVLSIYKINHKTYIDNIIKEVNTDVLTGKPNIIFNMEYVKIFSDNYAGVFADVYKATAQRNGTFIIVKPSEDVLKSLNYVFLNNVIRVFDTIEEAVQYIEMSSK